MMAEMSVPARPHTNHQTEIKDIIPIQQEYIPKPNAF